MNPATESRPGQATGAAQNDRTRTPHSIVPIPVGVDLSTLPRVETAVAGAILHVTPQEARQAFRRITAGDFTSAPLRVAVRAAHAVLMGGDRVEPMTLGQHAQDRALIRPQDRHRFDALAFDLHGVDGSPMAAGGLCMIPALIEATARRRADEYAQRVQQAVAECPADELAVVLVDQGRALEDAARRLAGEEVAPR